MKRFLCFATVVFLFACNDQANKDAKKDDTSGKESATGILPVKQAPAASPLVDPTPWKIDNATALKLKKYLNGCDHACVDNSTVVNYNEPVRAAIQAKYPNSKIIEVPARYKDLADEIRYCELRKFPDAQYCKVKNHKTIIYMVAMDSTNELTEDQYYDFVTICPPPRECKDSLQRN